MFNRRRTNKTITTDAPDYSPIAHDFAILCETGTSFIAVLGVSWKI